MNIIIRLIETVQLTLILHGFSVSTRVYLDQRHHIRVYKTR